MSKSSKKMISALEKRIAKAKNPKVKIEKTSKKTIGEVFSGVDSNLVAKFAIYHHENPQIFAEFIALAFEMKETGVSKYSAWTIVNKIRWDHDLATQGAQFKINNDFIALYARLAIYRYPSLANFFELRSMKASDRRDSSEERYRAQV